MKNLVFRLYIFLVFCIVVSCASAPSVGPNQSEIYIHGTDEIFTGRIFVYLNGTFQTTIARGKVKRIIISNGDHEMYAIWNRDSKVNESSDPIRFKAIGERLDFSADLICILKSLDGKITEIRNQNDVINVKQRGIKPQQINYSLKLIEKSGNFSSEYSNSVKTGTDNPLTKTTEEENGNIIVKQNTTGIERAINKTSREIILNLPENSRIAVINISSKYINLSAHIVDELEFQFVSSKRFTVVDRNTLDAIRNEQNFQMSGDVSDSSAVSIGQILGANIVITGSITEIGMNQRLSIRALDVRTSEILTMVREEF